MDIGFDDFREPALRFQDVFDRVTGRAFTATGGRDVVRDLQYLRTGISYRHGQPATPHDGQINHVVAQVGHLLFEDAAGGQYLIQDFRLVGRSLKDVIYFEVACAQGYGLGDPLGHDADFQPAQVGE